MKSVKAPVPEQVIEHVGNVLNRPVMAGIRFREEALPKNLQDEQGAFDERISAILAGTIFRRLLALGFNN